MNTLKDSSWGRLIISSLILCFYALIAGGSISIDFGAIFTFLLYIVGGAIIIGIIAAIIGAIITHYRRKQQAAYENSIGDISHLVTIGNDSLKLYYDESKHTITIAAFGTSAHSSEIIEDIDMDEHFLSTSQCYVIDRNRFKLLSVKTSFSKVTLKSIKYLQEEGWVVDNSFVNDFKVKDIGDSLYLFSKSIGQLHRVKSGDYQKLLTADSLPDDLLERVDKDRLLFCKDDGVLNCIDLANYKKWPLNITSEPDDMLLIKKDELKTVGLKDSCNNFYTFLFFDSLRKMIYSEYKDKSFVGFKECSYDALHVYFDSHRKIEKYTTRERVGHEVKEASLFNQLMFDDHSRREINYYQDRSWTEDKGIDSIRLILEIGGMKYADYNISSGTIDDSSAYGQKRIEDIKQEAFTTIEAFARRCPSLTRFY